MFHGPGARGANPWILLLLLCPILGWSTSAVCGEEAFGAVTYTPREKVFEWLDRAARVLEGKADPHGHGRHARRRYGRTFRPGAYAINGTAASCSGTVPLKGLETVARIYRRKLERAGWGAGRRRRKLQQAMDALRQAIPKIFPRYAEVFMFHPLPFDHPAGDVDEELFFRAAVDQLLQGEGLIALDAYSRTDDDVELVKSMLLLSARCADVIENGARMVALFDAGYEPWHASEIGPLEGPVALFLKHSSHRAWVKRIHREIVSAFERGLVSPLTYATAEDFMHMYVGHFRQIYGTYGYCRKGEYDPTPRIADEKKAQAFWKAHGAPSPRESCARAWARERSRKPRRPD